MRSDQLFIGITFLFMTLLLGACGPAPDSQAASAPLLPRVTIKTADFSFEAPAQIEAGLVSITLENDGQEPHHAQLVRLNDGVTVEQFQTALQQNPDEAFMLVTWAGGPGIIDPGGRQEVMVELTAGQYVLLCFVPSHDGLPHLAKGMVRPIEVVAPADQVAAPELKADVTVKLLDFSFTLPPQTKAGPQVWQVINEGEQIHEIALIKLAEGKTMEDVAAFMHSLHGAPPFESIGGFQALDPGKSGWLNLDLSPGNYVALCYVPDPVSGQAHLEMGMVMPFIVK